MNVIDRSLDPVHLEIGAETSSIERALGLQWCVHSDQFRFKITLQDQQLTRRGILSTVCSIYDPLGFIAPITLLDKQILQKMCREKAGWDDQLTEEIQMQWEKWRSDLPLLNNFHINRCFKSSSINEIVTAELHHFSDASTSCYGHCSYLRLVDNEQSVHRSLVMGKARVSALKAITIPRLELSAAVLSLKVSKLLRNKLHYPSLEEVFWVDSKVILGYININLYQ